MAIEEKHRVAAIVALVMVSGTQEEKQRVIRMIGDDVFQRLSKTGHLEDHGALATAAGIDWLEQVLTA